MKKLFCLIVVFSLIAVIFVLPVMADDTAVNNSCGDGVVWSYDEKSDTLTISGNGVMIDYGYEELKPWYEYELLVAKIVIKKGVTYISKNAFFPVPDYVTDTNDSQYRYKNLSISGLTFKLMQAIAIYYNIKSINKYLDLILIGEKWVESPKKGENSVIIKEGMKFLVNTNNYGLRSIMDAYGMININDDSINKIIDIITPTINVVTMTDNARIIIELLITNRKERAEQITKYLNKSKQHI
jgi:hypothetical protein